MDQWENSCHYSLKCSWSRKFPTPRNPPAPPIFCGSSWAVSAHTASTWGNRHGGYPTDHHADRLFHPVPPDHYRHLVDRRCLPDSRHHPGPYGADPPRRPAGSCSAAGSRRFRVAPSRLTGAPRYGPRRAGEETNAGRWDKEKSPSAFLPLAIGADSFNPELAARAASTSH